MATDWWVAVLLGLLFALYLILAWMSLRRSGAYLLEEGWGMMTYRGPYRTAFMEYVYRQVQDTSSTRLYLKLLAKVALLTFGMVALRCSWERRIAILPVYWEAE